GDPPLVRRLEVHAQQVFASRRLVGNLAGEVQAAAAREIRGRENVQRGEAGGVITDVRERTAAGVHALREVAAALECRRDACVMYRRRVGAALVFLAPEEEQLLLVGVEAGEHDWYADR